MNLKPPSISAESAAATVQDGDAIFLTGNLSTPLAFLNALIARYTELKGVQLIQLLGLGPGEYITPEIAEHIRVNSLFIAPNIRKAVNDGLADFTPVFLSQIPRLWRSGLMRLDKAVIQVSPPDEHGYCSYGVEVGVSKSAAETANLVIAEVNPNMPRTLGDSFIHVSQIDYFIDVDYELPELLPEPTTPIQGQIAAHIAQYIPDGATLQLGIGGVPNAVLSLLRNHKDLGIHTELFSDGVMEMINSGVITNARKTLHTGKVVAGFVLGSHVLNDFIHDNPFFEMHPTEYVNDPFVIAQNDRMVSINSALEVDITGQVCADSIGPKFYSGVGGQLDFVRGAARAKEGMTFIALPATAMKGSISRIVTHLKPGAGVVTTRNDVHWVVTEYGAVNLFGRTITERVRLLVSISDPQFQDDLLRYAHEQNYVPHSFTFGG
jgi:4-hydroxybutyrate CoA-transferase